MCLSAIHSVLIEYRLSEIKKIILNFIHFFLHFIAISECKLDQILSINLCAALKFQADFK